MVFYVRSSSALRAMFSRAVHFSLPKSEDPWAKAPPVTVQAEINGHRVLVMGRQVERTTLDGLVLVPELRSRVDGKWVNRAELFRLCGETVESK